MKVLVVLGIDENYGGLKNSIQFWEQSCQLIYHAKMLFISLTKETKKGIKMAWRHYEFWDEFDSNVMNLWASSFSPGESDAVNNGTSSIDFSYFKKVYDSFTHVVHVIESFGQIYVVVVFNRSWY